MRGRRGVNPGDQKPILVLGVNNILLRDEGIGVRVVEAPQWSRQ